METFCWTTLSVASSWETRKAGVKLFLTRNYPRVFSFVSTGNTFLHWFDTFPRSSLFSVLALILTFSQPESDQHQGSLWSKYSIITYFDCGTYERGRNRRAYWVTFKVTRLETKGCDATSSGKFLLLCARVLDCRRIYNSVIHNSESQLDLLWNKMQSGYKADSILKCMYKLLTRVLVGERVCVSCAPSSMSE